VLFNLNQHAKGDYVNMEVYSICFYLLLKVDESMYSIYFYLLLKVDESYKYVYAWLFK